MWAWVLFAAVAVFNIVEAAGAGAARLVCYVDSARATDSFSECSHLVYTGDARGDKLDALLKEYRKTNPRIKIVLRVSDADKDLRGLLKPKHLQGLELQDVHRSLNKTKVQETVEAARATIVSSGGGPLFLSLPANPELLAKYYDLRTLVKVVDLMVLETEALGLVKKMTYHPSRLSGMWDMMNTDSAVDLAVGLGVPASKLVISLPATARQFTLVNETLSTPGSPSVEEEPKEIDQAELCRLLQKGRWTLERDQDLSAPYAFKNKTWISFEDSSSVDVKGKYARVRGLAGLALKKADRDLETPCGATLKAALSKVLNQQSRAPRAAVLRSLEHEILSAPTHARVLDALQVSPYRITQVVDSDGVIHSIREDTRTEFSCSRQGYFVHPRSCARFYRCVKFDQLSPDYTVFEFDCPAGLAFDARYEVCVWPGSLPHSQACPGSSEIAPVPQTRFVCPEHEGYYADPENCRWFFACLDHGKAPLTAYEFRCPFGLGFDAAKLKCDWPWLVPACGNIARYEAEAYGFSAATLTGAAGYQGQTADSINVAGHQSLVSGAALDNLVGIQGGYLSQSDALDANFITSQELANSYSGSGQASQLSQGNDGSEFSSQFGNGLTYKGVQTVTNGGSIGLVQPTKYSDERRYTSGSLILDDYRYPSAKVGSGYAQQLNGYGVDGDQYNKQVAGFATSSGVFNQKIQSGTSYSEDDNSGTYVHDPTGDYAEPYKHVDAPAVPYVNDGSGYKHSVDYQDYGSHNENNGKYVDGYSVEYSQDQSGAYQESDQGKLAYKSILNEGSYKSDNSGSYQSDYSGAYAKGDAGKFVAGVYQNVGQSKLYLTSHPDSIASNIASSGVNNGKSISIQQSQDNYGYANGGGLITNTKTYTGASHTLAAGSVNVGLVGKTTLLDTESNYHDDYNQYKDAVNAFNSAQRSESYNVNHKIVHQTSQNGQLSHVAQPAVSISHLGTDAHNHDGYEYVTTPTSSGIPTTATPYAVTTALPAVTTYKTTFVPEAPKTSITEIFGYSQPAVTLFQPTRVPVEQSVTSKIEKTNYNQGTNYQYDINENSAVKSEESGYDYSKPSIKFEDGISYTTTAPAIQVSTFKPQGFSKQTIHNYETGFYGYSTQVPAVAVEEPYKKVVAYTTGPPAVSLAEPEVGTNIPQIYSQQTFHNSDSGKVDSAGYAYTKSFVNSNKPQTVVQYATAQPVISAQPSISTYQPQVYSQQTLHKVDANKDNFYFQETLNGYGYHLPEAKFEETPKSVVTYTTAQPEVSTYQPQVFGQQTLHIVDSGQVNAYSQNTFSGYNYQQPEVKLVETEASTAQPPAVSTYKPQYYSHQTLHKTEPQRSTPLPRVQVKYQQPSVTLYENPILKYTQNVTPISYVQPQPTTAVYTNTYQKPIIEQEGNQIVSQSTHYKNNKQQTYQQNLQYNQGYIYSQPEIQRNIETVNAEKTYSLASDVSQQVIHQTNVKSQYDSENKNIVIVSSTPATQVYEDHYNDFEALKKITTYKAPEYIPPKVYHQEITADQTPVEKQEQYKQYENKKYYNNADYSQQYESPQKTVPVQQVAFTTSHIAQPVSMTQPIIQQQYSTYQQTQNQYDYKQDDYSKQYETSKKTIPVEVSSTQKPISQDHYSSLQQIQDQYNYKEDDYQKQDISQKVAVISHEQPKQVESIHFSSLPGASVTYKPVAYPSPEIQVGYKAEDYLPPVSSTRNRVVTSTYRPRTFTSTTRDYLPPPPETNYNAPEYLPPKVENTYLPPSTTTSRGIYKSTVPSSTFKYVEPTTYKAPEYLPPLEETELNVQNYESYGLKNGNDEFVSKISINPYNKYRNDEATVTSSVAPLTRKQNIVIQTAKSNLLGFGTVGPDAGLVSYTSTTPIPISSTEIHTLTPKTVTSTSSFQQGLVEITPSPIPTRRPKPKVGVVTKINDFNPFLVRKLGAVCSCQSPVVVLKGKRPNVQIQQDYDVDYNNDYDDSGRGDISNYDIIRTSNRVPSRSKPISVNPSSTINPIIVPDDSYYQDIPDRDQENKYKIETVPQRKEISSESYITSTPNYPTTTQKVVRVRPRVKAITVAPSYETILLNNATPTSTIVKKTQESNVSVIDSQSFDRYGPGGWRSRDETLQGSVDCQRAGLFRHPKQCNKFYACRWDCTKQRFTLHVFNCPVQLSFDPTIGACNWPSQGPACQGDTLLTNTL